MLLRSVSKYTKDQNWLAVGIDFFIVVIGILLAFQITEWAAGRSDRERERQIIDNFLADIQRDRAEYGSALASDEYRVRAANSSLVNAGLPKIEFEWRKRETDLADYTFETSSLTDIPAERMDRLWSDIVIGYHPTPNTSTYDTLAGAGDMKVIRDRRIAREIQSYRNLQQSVINQTEKLLAVRQDVLGIGASSGLAPYVSVPAAAYFQKVGENPELAAGIRIMATFTIFHHGELKTADARAAKLQDILEEEYKQ